MSTDGTSVSSGAGEMNVTIMQSGRKHTKCSQKKDYIESDIM